MKFYTGWEYLCIDVANNYGLDKLLFEERITWVHENLQELENLLDNAETKPLYLKAVQALRKAQRGISTGHLVAVDAVCSGLQLMSTLTGCKAGAQATGLIDINKRADAYSDLTKCMNSILGGSNINIPRKDAKQALMTVLYGSKATPKAIFGDNTPELRAFYEAVTTIAPGAWEFLQDLLKSWQAYAPEHTWKMPDGFDVRVKVMVKNSSRVEVDELNHSSFTFEYYTNEGTEWGLSNCANAIHSCDAFVLREMHRRCNYDRGMVEALKPVLVQSLFEQKMLRYFGKESGNVPEGKIAYYVEQWNRSRMPSTVILPYITKDNVDQLPIELLEAMDRIVTVMLEHDPFELVTIHDAFAAHPNNVNWVRYWYKEILADMADSNMTDDLLSQIYKMPGKFNKLSNDLSSFIRNSDYALT